MERSNRSQASVRAPVGARVETTIACRARSPSKCPPPRHRVSGSMDLAAAWSRLLSRSTFIAAWRGVSSHPAPRPQVDPKLVLGKDRPQGGKCDLAGDPYPVQVLGLP